MFFLTGRRLTFMTFTDRMQFMNQVYKTMNSSLSWDASTPFGRLVYSLYKLWHPKNPFQDLFFQLHFNKKYVEVAINDFTMHLVVSKWLRRQKCRQKR